MTKKRSIVCGGIFAACVGLAIGMLAMLPERPGVTKANFDRIEIGMPRADVEEIFLGVRIPEDDRIPVESENFFADDGSFAVIEWSADYTVARRDWWPSDESVLKKIRRLLHLP